MKLYYKKALLFLFLFILINLLLVSCYSKKEASNKSEETIEETALPLTASNLDDVGIWRNMGERISALSLIDGIEDTVILVNEATITRREIETAKIYEFTLEESSSEKKVIEGIIKTKVIEKEVERLGIEPLQEDIVDYLEGIRMGLENKGKGMEPIIALIEGMGISQEEYLIQQKEVAYSLFRISSLREYLESKNENYEKYIEKVVKNAEIEILDPEIQKIFD